mmetsp:Transcript_19198/g.19495  ORF Transcript_19198/g.19495 Transcript_19198/m.19495 type:complete len:86 (-) Transcript_19198:2567-2824(-)
MLFYGTSLMHHDSLFHYCFVINKNFKHNKRKKKRYKVKKIDGKRYIYFLMYFYNFSRTFPTPGSPIKHGLFLRRRPRVLNALRIS